MDTKLKEFQTFLIKRFLLVMIIVSLIEMGVTSLINNVIIPFINQFFFAGVTPGRIGITGVLALATLILSAIVLELFQFLLPGRFQQWITSVIGFVAERLPASNKGRASVAESDLAQSEWSAELLTGMGKPKQLLLLLILLGCILMVVLPMVIGAYLYAKTVVRQFRIIASQQQEQRLLYERKRNLMLSDIAHDLRTPMTTVSGYAKALSDHIVPKEKEDEYLDGIMRKSKRMNELIDLLFSYVKTDSEGFALKKEKTDVCELLRSIAADAFGDIEDAGMELFVEIPEERCMLEIDRVQFTRSIHNLLTNAIRHNETGTRICVAATLGEDLKIFIADSGKTIEKEVAEHIFEPFMMGDSSRNSKGGSGLGSSIAKKIMDLHGFGLRLLQNKELSPYPLMKGYTKAFMISAEIL